MSYHNQMDYTLGILRDAEIVWTEAISGDSYGDAALFTVIKQLRTLGATEGEISALSDYLDQTYSDGHVLNILSNQTITAPAGRFSITIAHG